LLLFLFYNKRLILFALSITLPVTAAPALGGSVIHEIPVYFPQVLVGGFPLLLGDAGGVFPLPDLCFSRLMFHSAPSVVLAGLLLRLLLRLGENGPRRRGSRCRFSYHGTDREQPYCCRDGCYSAHVLLSSSGPLTRVDPT
jgi:hypothetical protein